MGLLFFGFVTVFTPLFCSILTLTFMEGWRKSARRCVVKGLGRTWFEEKTRMLHKQSDEFTGSLNLHAVVFVVWGLCHSRFQYKQQSGQTAHMIQMPNIDLWRYSKNANTMAGIDIISFQVHASTV